MDNLKHIAVLVPGRLHPHARGRIEAEFDLIAIERPDVSLLDDDTRRRIRGVAVSSGSKTLSIRREFIDSLPKLEIISGFGVGYDNVDAAHAATRGVMVTNTPDVLTEEVADTALGLLINTVRELPKAERWLREGRWISNGGYPLSRGTLRGRSVGIFGMGRIGLAIARRLEAFGLAVSYHNRRRLPEVGYTYYPALLEMARNVDTLISVAPGSPETARAVNGRVLEALGPDGVFINVGRGSTVDEEALLKALGDGTIMAAGLDVFADEPNVAAALLALENVVLLPHVGSASVHTRKAMADLVADNLVSWFEQGKALTSVPETSHVRSGGAG